MIPTDCQNTVCVFKTDPISIKYRESHPELCELCKMKKYAEAFKVKEPEKVGGIGSHFGKKVSEFCLEQ
jgi:hypothetical protein